MAPATASAQEIIVLTAQNNTASDVLVGDPGGRFHEYWFDYYAGAYVRVRNTPDQSRWTELTANRRRRAPIRAEVWSPNGLEDTSTFSRSTPARCTRERTFATDPTCLVYRAGSANVVNPTGGRFLAKVANHAPDAIGYTLDIRGLNTNMTVAGTGPGTEAPMMGNSRTAYTGTLEGKTGGNSVYFTFEHPGGGDPADGGAAVGIYLVVNPGLIASAEANQVGFNIFRGTQLLQTKRGGDFQEGVEGSTSGMGTNRILELDQRTTVPGLMTLEIFNGKPGHVLKYAVVAD